MNVSLYNTTDYENKSNWTLGENKPNSNPILSAIALTKADSKRAPMLLCGALLRAGFAGMTRKVSYIFEAEMGTKMLIVKDGIQRLKLTAAGLLSNRDPNDLNRPLPDRLLLENSATLMNRDGNAWDSLTKSCLNAKITKHLQVGGWPRAVRIGGISHGRPAYMFPMNLTPIGFSILRLRFSKVGDNLPLSVLLRRLGRLDTNVEKVSGFNTIRADLLQESSKNIYLRIYFSVDHGYTPIRYKRGWFERPEPDCLAFEVHSLEQVAAGLWFPSSGIIRSSGEKRCDGFQTIGKIVVNQGLGEKDFDIEFPPGTKVRDEIKDIEYVVKSP